MATKEGPNSIIDGLVLEIDPLSIKSYPQQRNILIKTDTPFNDGRLPSGNYNGINLYTATRSIYSENYYSWSSINGNTPLFSVTNNQPYTFSFYLDPVDTTYLTIKILGAGGEQIAISNISPSVIGRYSVTLTPNTSVTNYAQIYIGSSNGTQIKIGGIQLEVGSIASDYISVPFTKTTIADLSGNSNDGSLVNNPTYSELNNKSFYFDGSSQYISVNHNSNLIFSSSNSMSLSAWFKPTVLQNKWTGIVTKSRDVSPWYGIWINASNQIVWGSPSLNMVAGTTSTNWQNVVITKNNSGRYIYVNGVLINSSSTIIAADGTGPLYIGGAASVSEYFIGYIGDVKVYNIALSASEILQNFNALRGRYGI